jgi:hypothetical protein
MSYLFDLSTPTTINFEPLLTDPTGERIGQLAGANAARGAMRTSLKECKQNSGKRDWFKAVKVSCAYLLSSPSTGLSCSHTCRLD